MSSSTPFVDIETGTLDFGQIWRETYPILGLILLFGILGVIPLYLGRGLEFGSLLGTGLALIGQLIFAVGSGIVLMYIIVRAIQLSDA